MQIVPIDLADPAQVRQFLHLPFALYRNTPVWVPPLSFEAGRMLDRARHPFYRHSEAVFLLAYPASGKDPVGRLAVLDNTRYNAYNHEKTAFFYLFECSNDPEAAGRLFEAGLDWARRRGLQKIQGPKGFSALDGFGLLVQGFEHRPALGIPYNLPYYPALLEGAGFTAVSEAVSGYIHRSLAFPEKIHRAAALIQQRRGLEVRRFAHRSDLQALAPRLKELYNNSLSGTTGNYPLTDEEARSMADQILWFTDPKLIKIIFKDDEPVGFLFAYPDISAAIQRCRGRLAPFGWADVLLELRRTRWININGAGIVEKYRGLGGTALLFSEMQRSLVESRFEHADLVQIGVDNTPMQRELSGLGINFYKMHRLYERMI